jgi:hypothetical protein
MCSADHRRILRVSGQVSDQPKGTPWSLCLLRSQLKVIEVGPLTWNDLPAVRVYLARHDAHALETRHFAVSKAVKELMTADATGIRYQSGSLVCPVSATLATTKIHLCGRYR